MTSTLRRHRHPQNPTLFCQYPPALHGTAARYPLQPHCRPLPSTPICNLIRVGEPASETRPERQPLPVQGYLAHEKQPPPLGPPYDPSHMLLKDPGEGLFLLRKVPCSPACFRGTVHPYFRATPVRLSCLDTDVQTSHPSIHVISHFSINIHPPRSAEQGYLALQKSPTPL